MLTIGKSELKFEEIPNKSNRKIRINILNGGYTKDIEKLVPGSLFLALRCYE